MFVRYVTDHTCVIGKIGHCWHTKNERINFYALEFGSWFNKWFLERIDIVVWQKYELPHIVVSGPKHIFWWFLKTSKDKNKFSHKRFQITSNTHDFCG